jgi:hypothetical protein
MAGFSGGVVINAGTLCTSAANDFGGRSATGGSLPLSGNLSGTDRAVPSALLGPSLPPPACPRAAYLQGCMFNL